MKQCPRCQQTYDDDQLNFCLNDGELLSPVSGSQPSRFADDSPPTVVLNEARVTNPAHWPSPPAASPPAQWQPQPAGVRAPFGAYPVTPSPSQTLAVISLGLGIASMTIGWCCGLGMLLAPAALITGFIALSQIKKDPKAYGGRGLAIGGLVTATVFLSIYALFLIIYGVAIIGGGLN